MFAFGSRRRTDDCIFGVVCPAHKCSAAIFAGLISLVECCASRPQQTFSRAMEAIQDWPSTLSCSQSGVQPMNWEILWPAPRQVVDLTYDFGISNQMMVRTRIDDVSWQFKRNGYIFFVHSQHSGRDCNLDSIGSGRHSHTLISDAPNAEIFGFDVGLT